MRHYYNVTLDGSAADHYPAHVLDAIERGYPSADGWPSDLYIEATDDDVPTFVVVRRGGAIIATGMGPFEHADEPATVPEPSAEELANDRLADLIDARTRLDELSEAAAALVDAVTSTADDEEVDVAIARVEKALVVGT